MSNRIIVAAVAGFGLLLTMMNALQLQSEEANAATNSTALNTVDRVAQDVMMTGGTGIPMGMLVAGVAAVLFVALAVSR